MGRGSHGHDGKLRPRRANLLTTTVDSHSTVTPSEEPISHGKAKEDSNTAKEQSISAWGKAATKHLFLRDNQYRVNTSRRTEKHTLRKCPLKVPLRVEKLSSTTSEAALKLTIFR
ncbi:DNA polymerase [Striga asiatica]|uniref:DNA polymerase n=1 Tax=Striga asiatica TaxID=4170 RepID=A0A5A7QNW7_STRAF|nr:DNA polymerase [Striga asiatica]